MFKDKVKYSKLEEGNVIRAGTKLSATQTVEEFYSKNPFPNYEKLETVFDLLEKVKTNAFLFNLKKQFEFGNRIIEVGSGTSQLSIVLAHGSNNQVVAFDPTLQSLRLGANFAMKNHIKNCIFVNGDLYDDLFEDQYFDLVWCSGVLHHTETPREGYKKIVRWVKPGGYVIIGLYNLYGRMRTGFRQSLFKILGRGNFARRIVSFLDPVLRKGTAGSEKNNAWFQDQYEHPIESWHSLDEVLRWFEETEVDFINSVPSCSLENTDFEDMFSKNSRGNVFSRFFSQIFMLFSPLGGEGGLFLVIGKKR